LNQSGLSRTGLADLHMLYAERHGLIWSTEKGSSDAGAWAEMGSLLAGWLGLPSMAE